MISDAQSNHNDALSDLASFLSQITSSTSTDAKPDPSTLLTWSEEAKRRITNLRSSTSTLESKPLPSNHHLLSTLIASIDYVSSLLDASHKSLTTIKRCLNNLLDLLDLFQVQEKTITYLLDLSDDYWDRKQSTELIGICIKRYDISIEDGQKLYGKLLKEIDVTSRRSKCSIALIRGLYDRIMSSDDSDQLQSRSETESKKWGKWQEIWSKCLVEKLLKGEHFRDYLSNYHLEELFRIHNFCFVAVLRSLLSLLHPKGEEKAGETLSDLSFDRTEILPSILCVLKAGNRLGLCSISSESTSKPSLNLDQLVSGSKDFMSRKIDISKILIISIPTSLLLSSSLSSISEVQLSTITLSTESRSAKTLPSQADLKVLKSGLSNGLSTSDAKSRSQIKSLMLAFFDRLKVASFAAKRELERLEKKNKEDVGDQMENLEESLRNCKGFLEWFLNDLILRNLDVSLPWTTLTSSLSLLRTLLSSGIDPTYNHSQFNKPNSNHSSISSSNSNPNSSISISISIISPELVSILLNCMDSRFQDIQSQSLDLLSSFPSPLIGLETREKAQISLVDKAIGLMRGSRESESEAAAGLLDLYRKVYIEELGWPAPDLERGFLVNEDQEAENISISKKYVSSNAHLQSIFNLLEVLDSQVKIAESGDLLIASKNHPLHGILISLQKMVSTLDSNSLKEARMELNIIFRISKELIERIWKVNKVLLCSRSADGEWDNEVQTETDHELSRVFLTLSKTNSNHQDSSISLSHAHELILTYSFRGMKETASFLSCLTSKLISFSDPLSLLNHEALNQVGETFNKWMIKIRHRGAITTIFSAYSDLNSTILRTGVKEFKSLPDLWLKRFLKEIEDPISAERLSTTRQSAGLKYCVLALLSGRGNSREADEYVAKVLERLTKVIDDQIKELEIGSIVEEKSSFSGSIHSMNILKILLEDHTLGERIVSKSHPILESLLILSIKGFKSNIWDLRNSSMLLFSTCIYRSFSNQSTAKRVASSTTRFNSFFKRNVRLGESLRIEIEEALKNGLVQRYPNADLGGSLSAILVILSKVQVGDDSDLEDESLQNLQASFDRFIKACMGSRIWKVREQASLAYRSMTPSTRLFASASQLLSESNTQDQNQLHGNLLAVQQLLEVNHEYSLESRQNFIQAFESRISDLLEENRCFATKLIFVQIAISLDLTSNTKLLKYCRLMLSQANQDDNRSHQEPVASALLSKCAQVVLQNLDLATLTSLLQHKSIQVKSQTLGSSSLSSKLKNASYLQKDFEEYSNLFSRLEDMILDHNEDDGLRSKAAQVLVDHCLGMTVFVEKRRDGMGGILDRLCKIVWESQCMPLSEAVLPYLASLCRSAIILETSSSMEAFAKCCKFQSTCSDPIQSLPTRSSSVLALRALAPVLFSSTSDRFASCSIEHQRSLFQARTSLLDLLVDDDLDVRSEAALVVSEHISIQLVQAARQENDASAIELLNDLSSISGAASGVSSDRAFKWLEETYKDDHLMSKAWALYVWRMVLPLQGKIESVISPPQASTALFEADPPNLFRNLNLDVSRAFASSTLSLDVLGLEFAQGEFEVCRRSIVALLGRGSSPRNFEELQRLRHLVFQLSLSTNLLHPYLRELGASTEGEVLQKVVELERKYSVDTSRIIANIKTGERVEEVGVAQDGRRGSEKKYRIAMISDFFFPNVGGVEGHIFAVSQRLLARGHKVIIITHAYSPDRVGIRHLSKGLKVYYVPYQVIARQDTLPNFFSLFPLLRTILLRERIQIVHGHQALSSMAHEGILHSRPLGIKTVFTDHSLFGFADAASILTNKLLKFVLSDIDHVVCVSNTGKENTVLRAALDPSRVSVIPNAVVASQFAPDPANADPSRVTIIILSRLMYRKGVDLLIAAIPRLCARHSDIHFLIGGDGPKRVELEQMREKYMLQDRVELVGAVRHGDVRDHLTRGQIFLNTSLTEAFGTSIVEAACAGLFVVSTSVGGIPEVLPPEMTQLASPEEDDIVRAVEAALDHVRNGLHDPIAYHEVVKDMYSWSDVATRLEIVYDNAMETEMPTFVERLEKYYKGGVIAGKIFCIIVAVDLLFLYFLEWFLPTSQIDIVPSLQDNSGEDDDESSIPV